MKIQVEGRPVRARREAEDVVWFEFRELCEGPRSVADYIEIARCYQAVFLSGVPVMGAADDDAARRFISLVDEFYDRGVKLVVSAAADAPEALYGGERLAFEFRRTASRLHEMQGRAYLAKPHRPVKEGTLTYFTIGKGERPLFTLRRRRACARFPRCGSGRSPSACRSPCARGAAARA